MIFIELYTIYMSICYEFSKPDNRTPYLGDLIARLALSTMRFSEMPRHSDTIQYFMVEADGVEGYIAVDEQNVDMIDTKTGFRYVQVYDVGLDKILRGRGYGYGLYLYLLNALPCDTGLRSSNSQTRGSHMIWRWLADQKVADLFSDGKVSPEGEYVGFDFRTVV